MTTAAEHFPGCHPEDAEDQRPNKPTDEIQDVEGCWHCGTPTARGACRCWETCNDDDIPMTAIYHCQTCRRWWAYMTGLNITTITFNDPGEATS